VVLFKSPMMNCAGSPTVMLSAVAVIVTSSARRYLLRPLDVSTIVFILVYPFTMIELEEMAVPANTDGSAGVVPKVPSVCT